MNRREFIAGSIAGAAMLQQGVAAYAAPPANIEVEIDATKLGEPVSPLIFGGYMEPATTRVWAEMLTDRKFANAITNAPAAPVNPFFRRFMGEPWRPVGPKESIAMDSLNPFVGSHSPRITLDNSEPRGIQQGGLHVSGGKEYVGRIYLKGDAGIKVQVRLVWGPAASDSQTIPIRSLPGEYQKFPLNFKPAVNAENARLAIVGTGSGTFHVGAVSLMPADNMQGFHAGMIRHYRDAGFKMAKWPGGNFVSGYDWYDGLGDPDKRPPRPQVMWGNRIEPNDVGIHEFITFCRLLDAEPYLAINSGFGDARLAAEEVEYCNGSTGTRLGKLRAENGSPEPFNIRLWCIGNEMYGPWQWGHMALNQYWDKHNEIVEAMKKVDPSIKVTSAAASICEQSWCAAEQHTLAGPDMWRPPVLEKLPYQFGGTEDWDGWMLAKCADNIDHLSEHTYCYPDLAFNVETQRFDDVSSQPLQLRTRHLPNRVGEAFDAWQKYVDKMPSLKEKNIKFIFDEWGCRYHRSPNGGFRQTGMVTPLSYALLLHELFRRSDMVAASCATGGLYTVLTDSTGEAVGFSAEGLVLKVMQTHFGNVLPVDVSGNSPQQPVSGTPFVDAPLEPVGSPTYPLDVFAALSGDRKSFILSVVNPTETSQKFTHRISGVRLRGSGKLWQIAAPDVNAANEPGKKPLMEIAEIPQNSLPDSIEAPPVSVSVYEFDVEGA